MLRERTERIRVPSFFVRCEPSATVEALSMDNIPKLIARKQKNLKKSWIFSKRPFSFLDF